jgi:hypothetical protein
VGHLQRLAQRRVALGPLAEREQKLAAQAVEGDVSPPFSGLRRRLECLVDERQRRLCFAQSGVRRCQRAKLDRTEQA